MDNRVLTDYLTTRYSVRPDTGCWEWTDSRHQQGYGVVQLKGFRGQKAHRVSYQVHVGPIPEGLYILHSCDNPPCINPEHLRPGTQQENMDDMKARGRYVKGRVYRGVEHPQAKLTQEDVTLIREEYRRGVLTQDMLAEVYGVSQGQIYRIVRGKQWVTEGCAQQVAGGGPGNEKGSQ